MCLRRQGEKPLKYAFANVACVQRDPAGEAGHAKRAGEPGLEAPRTW